MAGELGGLWGEVPPVLLTRLALATHVLATEPPSTAVAVCALPSSRPPTASSPGRTLSGCCARRRWTAWSSTRTGGGGGGARQGRGRGQRATRRGCRGSGAEGPAGARRRRRRGGGHAGPRLSRWRNGSGTRAVTGTGGRPQPVHEVPAGGRGVPLRGRPGRHHRTASATWSSRDFMRRDLWDGQVMSFTDRVPYILLGCIQVWGGGGQRVILPDKEECRKPSDSLPAEVQSGAQWIRMRPLSLPRRVSARPAWTWP